MTGVVPIDRIQQAHASIRACAAPVRVHLSERMRLVIGDNVDRLSPNSTEIGTYTATIALEDFAEDVQQEARAAIARRYAQLLRLLSSGVNTRSALTRRARIDSSAAAYALRLLEQAGFIECCGNARDDNSGQLTRAYRLTSAEARHD